MNAPVPTNPNIPTQCNGCGKPLFLENLYVDDGCPCNTPRGVNFKPAPCPTCKTDNCVKPGDLNDIPSKPRGVKLDAPPKLEAFCKHDEGSHPHTTTNELGGGRDWSRVPQWARGFLGHRFW